MPLTLRILPSPVSEQRAAEKPMMARRFESLSAHCILAFSVSGLEISGNKSALKSPAPAGAGPLSLKHSVSEIISDNSIR